VHSSTIASMMARSSPTKTGRERTLRGASSSATSIHVADSFDDGTTSSIAERLRSNDQVTAFVDAQPSCAGVPQEKNKVYLACVLVRYHTVLAVKTLRAGSTPVLGKWRWKRQS
jgi:hypothetical protein